ncbi:MAG: class I SAM-dependent methyltransferase [Anaerolineae bacterium]
MTDILQQQIAYYRARAGEYDEWFYRIGRYDRGAEWNARWFAEVETLMREVAAIGRVGHTLELAAGTGNFTRELAKISQQVTALDASAEVLAINRDKVNVNHIAYQQADLFNWQPEAEYNLVFMAFWMSHVPPEKLDDFLATVRKATKAGGRVFMIDSMPDETRTSSAVNHDPYQADSIYHTRKLNDGQEFTIIKVFYEPEALTAKLAEHGFTAQVQTTGHYFWWANGVKR